MKSETIPVEGMSCQHCVARVKDALTDLEGVQVEAVDIGEVRVALDPARADRAVVAEAIRGAGYTPS